jgi:hypothetical protein
MGIIQAHEIEDLKDVVTMNETPWFMYIAKKCNIWFPSSGRSVRWNTPTKYVAYYETEKSDDSNLSNENPKTITYIAKNKKYWDEITITDARTIEELNPLFDDEAIKDKISSWTHKFSVVLTESPIRLKSPIKIGKMRIDGLPLRTYDLPKVINAENIDELSEWLN